MRQGVRTFYTLTITQVFSLIGSLMTGVAVGIWVFNETGDSTPLMLASFFNALPLMAGGSVAGVLADRWKRRHILIASDAGQAAGTFLLWLSFLSGSFQLWHLYAVSLWQGLLGMLQRPAMEASVTMLVPENHRDRANAIRQMAGPTAGVIAPVVTGFIYAAVGVAGVMAIDLLTFAVAIAVVCLVQIPQPAQTAEGRAAQGSLWAEMQGGFRFLWARRVLFYTMIYAAFLNFLLAGPMRLTTPYIITLTGSEQMLGVLLGILNLGIVTGGVVMSVWGGTRPRVHGIMVGLLVRSFFLMMYGVARTPPALGVALFFVFFTNPLVDASLMSLMQLKVPPDMQGRVFALLFQMMYIANPLSLLLTGPLVDHALEPAVGGPGWEVVAPLVGSRPGSGMGLLLVIAGGVLFALTLAVYAHPKLRSLERDLPDYVAVTDAV